LGPNFSAKAPKKSFHCQRSLLYGATNTDPHATEPRQNAAAKATWTERMGTKTPGKAGSVSKETQPRAPEIDTMAPRSRGPPPKDAARPINIKPANSSTHQSVVAVPLNPNAPAIPSTAPKQPNTNSTTPAELAKFVCVADGSRVRRPSSPLGTKPGWPRLARTRGHLCIRRCRVCPNNPPLRSKGRPRRPQFRPSERELASCVVRIARSYSTRCTSCSPERTYVMHEKLRTALETRTSEVRRTGLRRSGGEVYKIRFSQAVPSSEKPSAKAASPASRHTKSLSFGSMFASR